ncbi:MAG: hypothetical protein J2P21_07650 [Chloracidobacterium sp.]|nr:hypothetical protein [Chloracidobacterium sp.]
MKKDDHQNLDNQRLDLPEDRELNRLLAGWQAPESSGDLDERAIASYRGYFNWRRLWRRWLAGSIRIPVPLAAAAVLLLCATSFLAARKTTRISIESPPAVPPTKYVQVPVPVTREKIVTRVIRLKAEQGSPGSVNSARSDLANFRPVGEINILVHQGE